MAEPLVRIGALANQVNLSVGWLRQLADEGAIPSVRSRGGHRLFDVAAVRNALVRRNPIANAAEARREPPNWTTRFPLEGLQEDTVWKSLMTDLELDRNEQAVRIVAYAFTEMLNNAIDHSDGSTAVVSAWASEQRIAFEIADDGCGVFPRLRDGLSLPDDFASLQELTKGKRTTCPERHTGEGIFFTSKAVDLFQLTSAGIRWTVDNLREDVAAGSVAKAPGTTVFAEISTQTTRELREVFQEFTVDHAFTRTRPTVKLFGLGLTFVSRSEARRLLDGLDQFEEIEVDFAGVTDVGQGFVDELLRVWPASHPDKRIIPVNMSEAVAFMVNRGLPRDDRTS